MEYVVCLICLTIASIIASISPHHTMYAGRNRSIGRGWRNAVGGFGGGSDFLFEALGGFGVSLVGFEVDGDLKFGLVGVEVEDGEDAASESVS